MSALPLIRDHQVAAFKYEGGASLISFVFSRLPLTMSKPRHRGVGVRRDFDFDLAEARTGL